MPLDAQTCNFSAICMATNYMDTAKKAAWNMKFFKVQGFFCVIWGTGVMAPRKILKLRSSEIIFLAILLLI